jgi:hypothetical protein
LRDRINFIKTKKNRRTAMSEHKKVFNWQLYVGFILIAAGGLFLADQLLPDLNLMEKFWPLLIVLFGVTLFLGMLVARRRAAGLAIPGAVITLLGILFFIQNLFDLWETWAYAWALLISAVGIGMLIMNLYIKRLTLRRVAGLILGIGLLLFVVFGILFELVFFSSRMDTASGLFLGTGLVLFGLFILLSRLLFSRGKMAIEEPEAAQAAGDVLDASAEAVPQEDEAIAKIVSSQPLPEDATFSGLYFKSLGKVELTQGDRCSLRIETDEDTLKEIRTEISEGLLSIIYEPEMSDWMKLRSLGEKRPPKYFLTMKEVKSLDLAGAGNLAAEEITGENLKITDGGLGKLHIKGLRYQTLETDLSGLGKIVLDGEVQTQTVTLGGAGSYQADQLKSQEANVRLTGAGSATVWVEAQLIGRVSGAGSIRYKGSPTVEESVTGLGSIKPLE